jgi:glycosyltransferase involved in cell wall biosynthesis
MKQWPARAKNIRFLIRDFSLLREHGAFRAALRNSPAIWRDIWAARIRGLLYLLSDPPARVDLIPLFDTSWYLETNPDVAAAGTNPLAHYLIWGASEGRDPHPLFSSKWYLEQNPDVAVSGINPLIHFVQSGASEGRAPHPLFDTRWYVARYSPLGGRPINPLVHFLRHGARGGQNPHPLFDAGWYLDQNPDVAAAGINPLQHFIQHGGLEGRDPHPLFDAKWYLRRNSAIAATGLNPLVHYLTVGAAKGLDPNPVFASRWYLRKNPDVAAAGFNPLVHFVNSGATENRDPHPAFGIAEYRAANEANLASGINPLAHYLSNRQIDDSFLLKEPNSLARAAARYRARGEVSAAELLVHIEDEATARFRPNRPLNVNVDNSLNSEPTLNILIPSLQMRHASGGPNTAYLLGCALARQGARVAFVATDMPLDEDLGPIRLHFEKVTGTVFDVLGVRLLDASDRNSSLAIGYNDVLMATAWWTAQAAKAVAGLLRHGAFYYLIQDYEVLFYQANENYADAEATYRFKYLPIVNTRLLHEYLINNRIGRFADPEFAKRALVFEPAVDGDKFFPEERKAGSPRRLLFYARPTVAPRNLFALGVLALQAAVEQEIFGGDWEFVGIGEPFDAIPLGSNRWLKPGPWLSLEAYAAQMRGADILLSLMLSPHPSYPPLEMAACGGVVVTTEFGTKTAERLNHVSSDIIAVQPEIGSLLQGLLRAKLLSVSPARERAAARPRLSRSWSDSLAPVVSSLVADLEEKGVIVTEKTPQLPRPRAVIHIGDEDRASPPFYNEQMRKRERVYRPGDDGEMFSLITPAHDTSPVYLADLAHTIFGQADADNFEWLILDNGSTRADTIETLAEIAKHPRVRIARSPRNLGIVGGTRWCLENARGRYILPVDHDDLLFPDAVRTIAAFMEQCGFPPLAYTDEDKTDGFSLSDWYLKPDWDPVLFTHSCYIAHLTVLDRSLALALDCYGDSATEGCPDWDAFIRFMNAGQRPLHIPEVLYSWRKHAGSTSANYRSKPYIYASHRAALGRFLKGRGAGARFEVALSSVFDGTPDYSFRHRLPAEAVSGDTATLVSTRQKECPVETIRLQPLVSLKALSDRLRRLPAQGELLLHLWDESCEGANPDFIAESRTYFELFPDTVIVGGRLHDGKNLIEGGFVFGYGGPIGCPDRGNSLRDPGYFVQSWKPRSVAAVSARHCVVKRSFLAEALAELPQISSIGMLGPWLGAIAREQGDRVVYSPLIEARISAATALASPPDEPIRFGYRFSHLLRDPTGYGVGLDRSGQHPFAPAGDIGRGDRPAYEDCLAAWIGWRAERNPASVASDARLPTISVITAVYEKTDPALFAETASSVESQTCAPKEWIVLAQGALSPELERFLRQRETEGAIRLLRKEVNTGIQSGFRLCLEAATGDFVLPLDHDDLLTPDALSVFTTAAARNPRVNIFYSDEDLLIGDTVRHPYYRPDYDPVLLLEHSYIWHAMIFNRLKAIELGTFTEAKAE